MTGLATGLAANHSFAADAARFVVPAEDAPQDMAIMQWPVSRTVYADKEFLAIVQATIADIANAISDFQPVVMLADAKYHGAARRQLSSAVALWDIPTEDLWARDSGPIVVSDGKGSRAVRDISFNGWGGRQIHAQDGMVARRVAERLGLPVLASGLRGEAGGVEQDGHGLLIAHESSWVNDNRNPGMTRDAVGAALLQAYGADRILWAPGLRDEDITDYHIDSLVRLTGPDRALINLPKVVDLDDPFHAAAVATYDVLKAAGLAIDVIFEPEQRRVKFADFVASYANYFVCNRAVIAAEFGDTQTDAAAVAALRKQYPGREVIALNVDALGEIGGGLHCATHEVPSL